MQKRLGLNHVGPRNHALDLVEIPAREGAILGEFWGLYGPLKSIESLCCDVRSKESVGESRMDGGQVDEFFSVF